MNTATDHLSVEQLLDYWLHDSDETAAEAVDEHLMRCEACGGTLDELIALGEGVRAAVRAGAVMAVTSAAFVQRLATHGLRLREYRLPHNGSVNCTVAPDDELLVTRLAAPLQGVPRLDMVARLAIAAGAPDMRHELHDIPFDPQQGEVIYLTKVDELRRLPAHTAEVTLLAVEPGGTRELGRYTFRHRPWAAQ